MNLFLTVGTQLPFDRLTRALDEWIEQANAPDLQIFGQIGPVGASHHKPRHFEWTEFLTPEDFGAKFCAATHILSHAGMGTIISALVAGKPITVLPRKASLGEQRNDHQIATVRNFRDKPNVYIAQSEADLAPELMAMLGTQENAVAGLAQANADQALTEAIRAEIMV